MNLVWQTIYAGNREREIKEFVACIFGICCWILVTIGHLVFNLNFLSFSIMSSWSMVLLFLLEEIKKKWYILECPKKCPNIISWYLYAILHIAYNKLLPSWAMYPTKYALMPLFLVLFNTLSNHTIWFSLLNRFASMFFRGKNLSVTRQLRSFLYEEPNRRYRVCDRWSWMNKFMNTPSCVLEA